MAENEEDVVDVRRLEMCELAEKMVRLCEASGVTGAIYLCETPGEGEEPVFQLIQSTSDVHPGGLAGLFSVAFAGAWGECAKSDDLMSLVTRAFVVDTLDTAGFVPTEEAWLSILPKPE